ncbi:PQ loop repeat-domain-containing protein [Thamnocephalis sphaerospora]|uniref:PQ loop repeat-domain-containing protein n=1 Tax=Thamnocephalis sphaerospora TaxID=78915 RepID=A0A4P9XLN5_9FUNG|nr:PQ loop repeat-domain-containing protein [Thamnocephalis sphaerospora]|eukprot:RKP06784.1 PQ loop repeat-domain-containing protein [Thamnocephalis sphaerospora]
MYQNPDAAMWSALTGYISIGCWFIVFVPQIYENWRRQSSESLSIHFILIWIAGDLFNLAGVILQKLLFTMLLLALYYVLSDTILLGQIYYYRRRAFQQVAGEEECVVDTTDEHAPLLQPDSQTPHLPSTTQIYGTGQDAAHTSSSHQAANENRVPAAKKVMYVVAPMLLLNVTWLVSTNTSAVRPTDMPVHMLGRPSQGHANIEFLPQLLGYISALLYIGARIPQIILNYRNKSCEGLSLLMFFFSVVGNVTYCLSIFLYSVEPDFILINLPWIIGRQIFWQFYYYKGNTASEQAQTVDGAHM